MSQDMELSIRKLAASHPSILLRQLSILAALLQGRAHMDIYVLRLEYHLSLFHQVMGILELLQPQIFQNIYQSGLHSALECYFTLMRHHGQTKEAFSILCRFMDFLQNYTNQNTGQALKFIEPYTELMQDLASFNRNLISLQQIVQGLSLLKHKNRTTLKDSVADGSDNSRTIEQPGTSAVALGEGTSSLAPSEIDTDSRGAAAVILAPFNKPDIAPQHWSALVQVFKKKSVIDDIMSPLNEIEYITFKKPALLDDVFDKLLELLFHSSPNVRTQAHNLLTRHLKNNPGVTTTNANSVTAYIQCLNNEDVGIVQSALETLTEMVYCLNEYAPQILQTVFQLGIKSKINTYNHIRKCVLALLTQNAC
jgi:integrator complex subunit 1